MRTVASAVVAVLLPCLLLIAAAPAARLAAQDRTIQVADEATIATMTWVETTLREMQTIKAGMTRGDLAKVFEADGGISTRTAQTFHSRACIYFHVDVQFRAVGDARGWVFEGGRMVPPAIGTDADVIVTISRPYVALPVLD